MADIAQLAKSLDFAIVSSGSYTPLALHHALLLASSMAAVVSTASNRAAAVQTRSRDGCDNASLRQRSNVPTPTPSSLATSLSGALPGGSSRATALSLNSCPYRAYLFSSQRPQVYQLYRSDNYSDTGGYRHGHIE